MLSRVVNAVVVGVVVWLVVVIVGMLLVEVGLATVGGFLRSYAALFGLLAGLYTFFVREDKPLLR